MKILIATTNAGKLRDFRTAAEHYHVQMDPLPGLAEIEAPEEDAETFEGNARIKAEFYSRLAPGELVLADDSGLEVDALHGAPGVRSARYAADCGFTSSKHNPDERNNQCLLHQLADSPIRSGRYRCVLALAQNGIVLRIAEGSVEGEILNTPSGSGGFGYDPLFYLPERHQTMAEIPQEARQQVSHRGRALTALLEAMNRHQQG